MSESWAAELGAVGGSSRRGGGEDTATRSSAEDSTRMTLNDASFFHCIFTSTYAMDRTSPASGGRGRPSHRCIATVLLLEKSRWIEPRPA